MGARSNVEQEGRHVQPQGAKDDTNESSAGQSSEAGRQLAARMGVGSATGADETEVEVAGIDSEAEDAEAEDEAAGRALVAGCGTVACR